MLKKILYVSGKSGLHRLLSSAKNMVIVESLTDGKRIPVYASEKVMSLNDISVYTDDEEEPLRNVLNSMYKAEDGKAVDAGFKNAGPVEVENFFKRYLPNYDRSRVHASDIKKIAQWYNILIGAGFTSFDEIDEGKAEEDGDAKVEEAAAETKPKAADDKKAPKAADDVKKAAAEAPSNPKPAKKAKK